MMARSAPAPPIAIVTVPGAKELERRHLYPLFTSTPCGQQGQT